MLSVNLGKFINEDILVVPGFSINLTEHIDCNNNKTLRQCDLKFRKENMKKYFHPCSDINILDASQRGDIAEVIELLANDPQCIYNADERGYSAFHWSAYSDDINVFEELIKVNCEAMWELKTHKGLNCLHVACSSGSERIIRRILTQNPQYGIKSGIRTNELDCVNKYNETALHLSAAGNYIDIVALLLGAGASPMIKDQWQRTACQVATENGYTKTAELILAHPSYHAEVEINEEYKNLVDNVPEVSIQQGLLASELKAKFLSGDASKFTRTVEPLVKHIFKDPSSDNNASVASNLTPSSDNSIHQCTKPTNSKPRMALSKLVEFPGNPTQLQSYLSDETIDLNGKDMYGITALMKFAAWDKEDLVRMLIERLSAEQMNVTGGKQRIPCLHYCVDMDAARTLRLLLLDGRLDPLAADEHGRDYREHAIHCGKQALLDAVS